MECTAYNFYIFVIYLSLLSPVKWKQRIITLLIFLGAVFVVNNMRFITMGYIGKHSPHLFHYIHDYLWNILFGFMVFLIWAWRYKDTMDTAIELIVDLCIKYKLNPIKDILRHSDLTDEKSTPCPAAFFKDESLWCVFRCKIAMLLG